MGERRRRLLPIGLRLRFALFGLECALGVSFNGVECERLFRDAAEDRCAEAVSAVRLAPLGRLGPGGRVRTRLNLVARSRRTGCCPAVEAGRRSVEFHAFRCVSHRRAKAGEQVLHLSAAASSVFRVYRLTVARGDSAAAVRLLVGEAGIAY